MYSIIKKILEKIDEDKRIEYARKIASTLNNRKWTYDKKIYNGTFRSNGGFIADIMNEIYDYNPRWNIVHNFSLCKNCDQPLERHYDDKCNCENYIPYNIHERAFDYVDFYENDTLYDDIVKKFNENNILSVE